MTTPKILVFIPAYRCAQQIPRVIRQFTSEIQALVHTVMVVDNRSPDDTMDAAIRAGEDVFTDCDFLVWKNDDNYGLGGSHKAAFRYAVSKQFTHLIVLHGDDQADIKDIAPLLKSGEAFDHDCLLGSRFMRGSRLMGYSKFRTLGNRVYNALFSLVCLRRIDDLGSGLNLYKLDQFVDFYYKTFPDDLTFNYLMLLGSIDRKQDVKFFPISWKEEDQQSNVRLFSQAFKVLALLSGYAIHRSQFLKRDVRQKPFAHYSGEIVFEKLATTPST